MGHFNQGSSKSRQEVVFKYVDLAMSNVALPRCRYSLRIFTHTHTQSHSHLETNPPPGADCRPVTVAALVIPSFHKSDGQGFLLLPDDDDSANTSDRLVQRRATVGVVLVGELGHLGIFLWMVVGGRVRLSASGRWERRWARKKMAAGISRVAACSGGGAVVEFNLQIGHVRQRDRTSWRYTGAGAFRREIVA
ncbi:transducin family protein / WD-40 repeat family protein [Striga asiatica]|uniref:Transducin family protein / WD-40 repeat family protein n=1 Tax=Striga asiatica TaxID=4170 RepID=A0A5A7Q213_STRAF|nr:transducin family protein / WD-40 repeat family protein [Striga asiatica]